jgi:hypothetical protein
VSAEDHDGILLPGLAERQPASRAERRADAGVAGNARLTASNAVVLLVLLAAEGVTILRVRALLTPHVFVGMVLVPPVLLKVASTGWRFARYYRGAPAYRRKGPPPLLLRLLGPAVVILTVAASAPMASATGAPARPQRPSCEGQGSKQH